MLCKVFCFNKLECCVTMSSGILFYNSWRLSLTYKDILSEEALLQEYRYLSKYLLGFRTEDTISRLYSVAVKDFLPKQSLAKIAVSVKIDVIIKNKLDVEAIEYFIRRKYGVNTLTQRLLILLYYTECSPHYYKKYLNEKKSFFMACFIMFFFVLRSFTLFFKGAYLTRRYRVV